VFRPIRGASRIFYYNSIMRRYLKVPQTLRGDGALYRRWRLPAGSLGHHYDG
jgi:hypothetical protein